MTYKLLDVKWLKNDEAILTIEMTYKTLPWMDEHKVTRKFVGACTVWHTLANFTRCSSSTEEKLEKFWRKSRFERDYGINI